VIFIDDLDRCRPDKVAESLEAVNYLVSHGACFVVLGVARKQVEASLALHFADIAEEISLRPEELRNARESGTVAQKRRSAYARLYLRKLVNLWVRVPTPDNEAILNMIARGKSNESLPTQKQRFTIEKWEVLTPRRLKLAAFVCLALLAGFGSYWVGRRTAEAYGRAIAQPTPGVTAGSEPGQDNSAATPDLLLGETNFPRAGGGLVLAQTDTKHDPWQRGFHTNSWYLLIPLAVGLAALYRALTWPRDVEFMDRKDFRDALGAWLPLVGTIVNSPRDQKRFVNRVRYIALRERKPPPGMLVSGGSSSQPSENNHEAQLVRLDVLQLIRDVRPKLSEDDQRGFDRELQAAESRHLELFKRIETNVERTDYTRISKEVEFV
jgi:KAP family P-loop domain